MTEAEDMTLAAIVKGHIENRHGQVAPEVQIGFDLMVEYDISLHAGGDEHR